MRFQCSIVRLLRNGKLRLNNAVERYHSHFYKLRSLPSRRGKNIIINFRRLAMDTQAYIKFK